MPAASPPPPPGTGPLFVILAAALWGTTGTASSLAPESASALSIGALRIIAGGTILVLWAWARGGLRHLPRNRSGWLAVAVGAVAVSGFQIGFFQAVALSGVAVGTVVTIGSGPVFAGLISRIVQGQPLTLRWLLSTCAAIAGCVILAASGGDLGGGAPGVLVALLAGFCYAVYIVCASVLIGRGVPPTTTMASLFGVAALLLVPLALFTGASWAASPRGAGVVAYLAIVTTVVAYVLYGRGLKDTPAAAAATLGLVEPAIGAVLGLLVLREPSTPGTYLGLLLVALAMILLTVRRRGRADFSPAGHR